jgi:hypothetical protein
LPEDKDLSKELKAEHLYALFKALLASIIEGQEAGALDDIPITFGGITKKVNLKVLVICIIGDSQSHYFDKLYRLCCRCNMCGDKSGHPLVQCKKINMVRMIQLLKDNNQDIWTITINTNCIICGLMSVTGIRHPAKSHQICLQKSEVRFLV